MNHRAILTVVRKDLKVVRQNKGVVLPIIIVPLVIFVLLPGLAALVPSLLDNAGSAPDQLEQLLARMPLGLQRELVDLNLNQKVIVLFLVYLLAPMFLILPLMVASVIAADSFAGEKERKTLEALLYTPTTDRELFVAKLLSAWLAAIAVAAAGFVLYALVANAVAWPVMERVFFPNVMWLAMIVWLVPAVAGLGLLVMVLISSRAQGFQDAYQLGTVVVVPVLLLVFGQAAGAMYFNAGLVLLLGLMVWLLNALLLWFCGHGFKRELMLTRS